MPLRIKRLLDLHRQIRSRLAEELGEFDLPLPEPSAVRTLAELKHYEDALDALICGWVGTRYLGRQIRCYGDQDAAIWIPLTLAEVFSLRLRPRHS